MVGSGTFRGLLSGSATPCEVQRSSARLLIASGELWKCWLGSVEISSKALIYLKENRKALYLLALIGNSWTRIKDLISSDIGITSLGALHYYADMLVGLGLIECERVGRYRYCRRTGPGEKVLGIVAPRGKLTGRSTSTYIYDPYIVP